MRITQATICLGLLASAAVAQPIEVSMVPISATGPHTIVGNEIILEGGDQIVILEVRLADWDPDATADTPVSSLRRVKGWQVQIDRAGFTSGIAGTLTAFALPCTTNGECQTITGPATECAGGRCPSLVINRARTDYIYTGIDHFSAVDLIGLRALGAVGPGVTSATVYRCTDGGLPRQRVCDPAVCPPPPDTCDDLSLGCPGREEFGIPDGVCAISHGRRYLVTVALDVPSDARGTFTVAVTDDFGTQVTDGDNQLMELARAPALISIACATTADCDDANVCTDDACTARDVCQNVPLFDEDLFCCRPADGLTCDKPSGTPGDADGDLDVDLFDFAVFQTCFGIERADGACATADLHCNCQADLDDAAALISQWNGPGGS